MRHQRSLLAAAFLRCTTPRRFRKLPDLLGIELSSAFAMVDAGGGAEGGIGSPGVGIESNGTAPFVDLRFSADEVDDEDALIGLRDWESALLTALSALVTPSLGLLTVLVAGLAAILYTPCLPNVVGVEKG